MWRGGGQGVSLARQVWCQALWGHCQVIPGEEAPSLEASHPPVYRKCRTRAGLWREAGRWRQERTDRLMGVGGGEGGHRGGAEVPRLSLEQQDEVWSPQECQVCCYCCSSFFRNASSLSLDTPQSTLMAQRINNWKQRWAGVITLLHMWPRIKARVGKLFALFHKARQTYC